MKDNLKWSAKMLELSLLSAEATKLVREFIDRKNIKLLNSVTFLPGTLVRYLPDNSIGMITEVSPYNPTPHYCYATFFRTESGSGVINDLGGVAWVPHSKFELLGQPTVETLSLLNWYKQQPDGDEDPEDEEEDDEDDEVIDSAFSLTSVKEGTISVGVKLGTVCTNCIKHARKVLKDDQRLDRITSVSRLDFQCFHCGKHYLLVR
jgi:bacterioferritin-associated ferredoxin